jgi:uncharacterized phosphatase
MTLLYVVRHGETDWNRERRVQGSTDIPLNATGRAQAKATGSLLAARDWDAVISSPLVRALETARIIAKETGMPQPSTDPALVERSYGAAEGLNHDEIDALFPGNTPVPGREDRRTVAARVLPALVRIANENVGKSLIVVSHGGVIRSILNSVEPHRDHGAIRNGSVHSFEHRDGALSLIAFDDPIEVQSDDRFSLQLDEQNALESRESVEHSVLGAAASD